MKLDIIKSEDIYTKGFKYISNFSESNTLPYHNINHLLTVFNNSYSASKYYKLDEILGENSTKELCLAALFHDTNHSGGELSDVDNVNNSIKFFKKFYNLYNGMEDHFSDNVCKIISCTKYPYDKLHLNMQQKIIRDCDMMSFTEDSHLYSVIFGLQNEFKIDMVSDQIKNQISFMLNLEFNTEWAKSIFESKYGYLMSDLNIIQNIFKDDIYTKEVEMLEMYENEK